jgi:hypothetical protein
LVRAIPLKKPTTPYSQNIHKSHFAFEDDALGKEEVIEVGRAFFEIS